MAGFEPNKVVHTVDAKGLVKRHQVAKHISTAWLIKTPDHGMPGTYLVDVHPSMRRAGVRFLKEVYEEQGHDLADYHEFLEWDRHMAADRVGSRIDGNFSEFPSDRLPRGVTLDRNEVAASSLGVYKVPEKKRAKRSAGQTELA